MYWLDNNKALSIYFQFGRPLSHTAEIGLKQKKNIQGNSFFGRTFLKGMFSLEKKELMKNAFFVLQQENTHELFFILYSN